MTKKILIIALFAMFAFVQVGSADEATHKALAEELLTIMEIPRNMEESFEMMKEIQQSRLQQLMMRNEEASDTLDEMNKKIMDMMAEEMSWNKVKADFIQIYVDVFTEEDLKGIIDFYKGPIGQKYIEKTPELMRRSMELSQKQMGEIMPKLQQMTEEMLQVVEKEAAVQAEAPADAPAEAPKAE